MRNLKKFLALVLAMLMVVSAGATVSAYSDVADDDAYAAAIAALTEWGIVMGTELGEAEDGSDALYEPNADVTRWQMALMMARTLAPEVTDDEWAEGMEIFGDVTEWYGAIAYAYIEGIVNGVSTEELVFKPNDGIKYQDGLIMALRALGYEVDCSGIVYWLDAYTQAKAIGLTENIAITKPEKTMTRGEMAQLIYNMINLPFADGSYSLAIKYYGAEAPAEPEIPAVPTQFVITATPKQAYVEGQHIDATLPEGETATVLVGLQQLVAGIPDGDILYVPAAALGIADADVENYFHYSVVLYNYDATYGTFDDVKVGADPEVIRSTNITVSGNTIKAGKYTYTTVASLTDAALRNEIVVFAGDATRRVSKFLLFTADGDIKDVDGSIKALYAYTLGGTDYYVHKPLGSENNVVISYAKALELYGVEAADNAIFTEYETMEAKDLSSAAPYQLSLFDDDGDGKYDRAIFDSVYMAVYYKKDSGKELTLGPWNDGVNDSDDEKKAVTFTEEVTIGELFTYTYNNQTNVVTVLEKVAPMPAGQVTNIILDGDKVVIGGQTYIIGSASTEAKMGADLQTTSGKGYDDIDDGFINYTTIETFYSVGSNYNFYQYNGYILAGKKITPADVNANWKYFVSNGAYGYDSTGVKVKGYVANGEETEIEITVISDETGLANLEKDTAIADMNIFELGEFLAEAKELFAKGNIFKVIARDDGTYRLLSNKFDGNEEAIEKTTDAGTKYYEYENFDFAEAVDGRYVFEDGKSNAISDAKATRIRTNANTVFYFVEYDVEGGKIEKLSLHRGMPKDDWYINVDTDTVLFADKIGYGTSTTNRFNGTASTVVVYYSNVNDIGGFNLTNFDVDYDIVYVTKFNDNAKLSIVPASEVTDETAVAYYYKTTGTNAINMATGATIGTIYAETKITANGFYKLYDGKLLGEQLTGTALTNHLTVETIDAAYVASIDFDNEWLIFGDIDATTEDTCVDAITAVNNITEKAISVKVKNSSKDEVKALLVANTTAGKVNNVYYLDAGYRVEDSTALTIVILTEDLTKCSCCADCTVYGSTCGSTCTCTCKQPVTVTGNATYHYLPAGASASTIQQVAKVVWKDGKVGSFEDLTLEVYDADGTISDLSSVVDPGRCALAIYKDTTTNDVTSTVCAGYAQATEMNGEKMIIDIYKDLLVNDEYLQLEAGQYKIRFTFTNKNVGDTVTRYIETAPFVIEAAE